MGQTGAQTINGVAYAMPYENNPSLQVKEKKAIADFIANAGRLPSDDEIKSLVSGANDNGPFKTNALAWAKKFIDLNKINLGYDSEGYTINASGNRVKDANGNYVNYNESLNNSPEASAFNQYWNDIYSREGNGLGKQAYDAMLNNEYSTAEGAYNLANAQAQQTAMAQAQTVKSITDSIRAERMAKLRAGMNESQIASQDMQTMMANTNALNDQIAASNLAKLQAQQQMSNAQNTAYINWLNSMNQSAQAGSAFAAADAGNADMLAQAIMRNTGMSYQQAYKQATGQINNNK